MPPSRLFEYQNSSSSRLQILTAENSKRFSKKMRNGLRMAPNTGVGSAQFWLVFGSKFEMILNTAFLATVDLRLGLLFPRWAADRSTAQLALHTVLHQLTAQDGG